MLRFKDYLNERGLICTIRESKGIDISAACGQLKEKKLMGILEISLINFYSNCSYCYGHRILYTKKKEEK